MTHCYCGSNKPFQSCCGIYHKHYNAPTALSLMKSRYSAFCDINIDYIEKSQRGEASLGFNRASTKLFAESVTWLGLEIIRAYPDKQDTSIAYVEFIARFLENDQLEAIHEVSEFHFDSGLKQWFYCKGYRPIKKFRIANNAPCPCRSGKKYKNCHGKS